MNLIETIDGTLINGDLVLRWEPIPPIERKPGAPPPPGGAWALFDVDGNPLGATDEDPTLLAWPVVPAYPGFRVLVLVPDEAGEPMVEEHHVIAWRIPPVGDFPMPVTLTDVPDSNCVIQSPTDHVIAQGFGDFANRDQMLEAYKKAKARDG